MDPNFVREQFSVFGACETVKMGQKYKEMFQLHYSFHFLCLTLIVGGFPAANPRTARESRRPTEFRKKKTTAHYYHYILYMADVFLFLLCSNLKKKKDVIQPKLERCPEMRTAPKRLARTSPTRLRIS